MSRWRAYGVGLTLAVAVASPALSSSRRDSYPLSTYPMFSLKRERTWVYQLAGVRDGTRTPLPPGLVTGGGEVMQAALTLRRSAEAGPEAMRALCERVAERARQTPRWRDLETLELAVLELDPVAYFAVGPEPASREVLARCTVRQER